MELKRAADEDTAMPLAMAMSPAGRTTNCKVEMREIGVVTGIGVDRRTAPKGVDRKRAPDSGKRGRRRMGRGRGQRRAGNRWSTAAPRRTAAGSDWKEGIRQGSG